MGNLPFTCPSTNFNVQHWRDEDDEDAPDNEYEVVMCKACAVALDQPKDRKSSGTRGRGRAKHWVKVKNRKHPAMETGDGARGAARDDDRLHTLAKGH